MTLDVIYLNLDISYAVPEYELQHLCCLIIGTSIALIAVLYSTVIQCPSNGDIHILLRLSSLRKRFMVETVLVIPPQ